MAAARQSHSFGFVESALRWIPQAVLRRFPALGPMRRRFAQRRAEAAALEQGQNRFAAAALHLRRAIHLDPEDAGLRSALGRVYYNLQDLERARESFQTALAIDFKCADAWKGLGFTLHRQGKMQEAIYCYLKFAQERPDDAQVRASLIEALESAGKYDEAITAAELACTKFPDAARFHFLAGRSHFDGGNLDKAVLYMQRAVELSPETPEIHRFFGTVLATRGDVEQALMRFRKSLELDPENATAYLDMARLFDRLERNEEYLAAAQSACRLSRAAGDQDGLKRALGEEGWALYKLRRWPESIQASEMALQMDGTLATVRFNLGLALLRNHDVARAQAEYRKALDLGDAGALKLAGIHDLECALREEPNLPGGRELYDELRRAYGTTTLSSRTTRRRAPSSVAGAG